MTFTVSDETARTGSDTRQITVMPANDPPTAVDDAATTDEDTTLVVSPLSGVLSNDTDPDSADTQTVTQLNGSPTLNATMAAGAGVTIAPDGAFTYDPRGVFQHLVTGESATDTFTYTMRGSAGAQSTATVTITITGIDTRVQGTAARCTADAAFARDCLQGRGLDGASELTASPDGKNVYAVSSIKDNGVVIFDRASDGTLTEKPGPAGCITEEPVDDCVVGRGLVDPLQVAVSPDGAHVYVASDGDGNGNGYVAIFDRAANGSLAQKAGPAGCISEIADADNCQPGRAITEASAVSLSPDGNQLYVATYAGAVAVFDRNADGTLSQDPGTAGCVSEVGAGTCTVGHALGAIEEANVTPDGASVYAVGDDQIAVLDRNVATGALTQRPGTAGCVSQDGTGGTCAVGRALEGTRAVATSPDNANVYVSSGISDAVAVFDRDTSGTASNGTLTQKLGVAGCVAEAFDANLCLDGRMLVSAVDVAVSPDGHTVFALSNGNRGVAILDRASDGSLSQKPSPQGCLDDEGGDDGDGGPCVDGLDTFELEAVAISPDGRNIYLAAYDEGVIEGFDR